MNDKRPRILVADDENISLTLLQHTLTKAGYLVDAVRDGQQALDQLAGQGKDYQAVILDHQMPQKTGLEVLQAIKSSEHALLPVILQTAEDSPSTIQAGFAAGAFYYLTKPFTPKMLLSVLSAALEDARNHEKVSQSLGQVRHSLSLARQISFDFRTPEDVTRLSSFIANYFIAPDKSEKVAIGLFELMLNAVEHGNLNINYDEKTQLIDAGRLQEEIQLRLNSEVYSGRSARISVEIHQDHLQVLIQDQGEGFDYEKYLTFSPERLLDNHGRGIMLASKLSFDQLSYHSGGSKVEAWHYF